ncbi:hypothetical protein ASD64_18810 [Mesorhizobium sp. Root157]|nr:hypothetical protein ASD64_18810 [Mesorhizobium sp. Root157]
MMTFKEYLANRQATKSPRGAFIDQARCDTRFPNVKTWREVEAYLLNQGAEFELISAGRNGWIAYRRAVGTMAN